MPHIEISRLFRYLRFISVSIVEYFGFIGCAYSLSGITVPWKPIMMHFAFLLWYAANHHGSLWCPECIVMDIDRCSRYVCAVFAVASTMHIETMAQRYSELDVVPGHVTVAGPACARNRVPVEVE